MTQNISPKIAFFDEKSCKLMLSSFLKLVQYDEKRSKISLIDSVNSVLIFENDEKIVDLTIVNPQIPVDKAAHKKSIFDIRAKYNNGEQIIIEMQRESAPDFKKRSQHINKHNVQLRNPIMLHHI